MGKFSKIGTFLCGVVGVVTQNYGVGWFDGLYGILLNVCLCTIISVIGVTLDGGK